MNQIPYQQHCRIFFRANLMNWRLHRTKNFAQKTGRSLEEALLYIRERCSGKMLSDAVDEVIAEMDAVVDPGYHSSNEPVYLFNHKTQ